MKDAPFEIDESTTDGRLEGSAADGRVTVAAAEAGQDETGDMLAGLPLGGTDVHDLLGPPRRPDETRGLGPGEPDLAACGALREINRDDLRAEALSVVMVDSGPQVLDFAASSGDEQGRIVCLIGFASPAGLFGAPGDVLAQRFPLTSAKV